jgi:hypothetical protein
MASYCKHGRLWDPIIYYRYHKNPSPDPILIQLNPVHILTPYLFAIHFNISSSLLPDLPNYLLPSCFPLKCVMYFSHVSCVLRASAGSVSQITNESASISSRLLSREKYWMIPITRRNFSNSLSLLPWSLWNLTASQLVLSRVVGRWSKWPIACF